MDAVEKQLAEVRNEIEELLSPYGLTLQSPSLEIISSEDADKLWNLREKESQLEIAISFREKMKQDSGFDIITEYSNKSIKEMQEPVNHKVRIGKRIAELRKERGLSQAKLSQITGIQSSYIGQIELGKYDTGIEALSKIGSALGLKLDFVDENPE